MGNGETGLGRSNLTNGSVSIPDQGYIVGHHGALRTGADVQNIPNDVGWGALYGGVYLITMLMILRRIAG